MMKKQLFYCFLFLFSALLLPTSFSLGYKNDTVSASVGQETNCPAPAPGWLITTNITPTSVSLMWEQAQLVIYYKVEGYDITGGFALPTYYTSNNTITYSGLSPGHEFQFSVRASYCANPGEEDLGPPVFIGGVKTIIIEAIVQLQNPCTPDVTKPTGNGVGYSYCVFQSTAPNAPPYNNGFVGQITYNNSTLLFGIAANGTGLHVGELGQNYPGFSFQSINNGAAAECRYRNGPNPSVLLFTINDLSMPTSTDPAGFSITFTGNYGNFMHCGSACVTERPSEGGGSSGSTEFPAASEPRAANNSVVQAQIRPNPFTESTSLQYELTETSSVEINLYDATGRLVQAVEKTDAREAGQYEAKIEGAGLPAGVYFLRLTTGQNHKTFAVVKQE